MLLSTIFLGVLGKGAQLLLQAQISDIKGFANSFYYFNCSKMCLLFPMVLPTWKNFTGHA